MAIAKPAKTPAIQIPDGVTRLSAPRSWKPRQGESYDALWTAGPRFGNRTLKIEIHVDSYDFQSHAQASVWQMAQNAWSVIDSIPFPLMRSFAHGVMRDHVVLPNGLAQDEAELLRRVMIILSGTS